MELDPLVDDVEALEAPRLAEGSSQYGYYPLVLFNTHRIHVCHILYGNIYHQYTPNVSIYTIHGSYGICIWANYNDLTVLPNPGIMVNNVNKRNHPKMAALFRLVNYYNLPRCMESINGGYPQMDGL